MPKLNQEIIKDLKVQRKEYSLKVHELKVFDNFLV